jgi:hypothetical protein
MSKEILQVSALKTDLIQRSRYISFFSTKGNNYVCHAAMKFCRINLFIAMMIQDAAQVQFYPAPIKCAVRMREKLLEYAPPHPRYSIKLFQSRDSIVSKQSLGGEIT